MVCGRMATASPAPQPQARGAGSTTEPANSHSGTWALRHERPLRRWRDMTDGCEIDEDAVVRSVAVGPTAAARAEAQRHQDVGRLAAATGADWVPPSVEAWTACLADNEEYVRELLAKATTARRSRSYRLEAAPDIPEPALRTQPHPQPLGAASMTSLEKLLRGRIGWFFVGYAETLRLLFIANYAGHTFAVGRHRWQVFSRGPDVLREDPPQASRFLELALGR